MSTTRTSAELCDDYARERDTFEAERHSEAPEFNEDFMVPRGGRIHQPCGCRACVAAEKIDDFASETAKVMRGEFCDNARKERERSEARAESDSSAGCREDES